MWRTIRYDRDGRVRRWQPTLPRLAAFVVAAGLSSLVARPGLRPVSPAEPPPAAAPCDEDPPFVVVRGRFVSRLNGYSIDIPDDAIGFTATPRHECSIVLEDYGFDGYRAIWAKKDDGREIWVDGECNVTFVVTIDEAVDDTIAWRRAMENGLRVLARERASLDGVEAVRVTVEYEERATNRHVVEEWVTAGRRRPGRMFLMDGHGRRIDDYIYSVGLQTTPEHRAEDEATFDRVLGSWHLRPFGA